MSTNKKIKTALVGFGKSAMTFHLPLLECINGYEIASIVSSRKDVVKSRLPNVEVYKNLNEMLTKSEIDLVIITTPNQLHYPQAKESILAKKHVVVEKPFVLNSLHGEELIELANKNNIKLSVYHNRRWDAGYLTLKKLVENGELGKINLYEARYDRYKPEVVDRWREQDIDGAGILWDLGSHLIDQALQLFGQPEDIISDTAIQKAGGKSIDYFHIVFKYPMHRVILRSSSLTQNKTIHITTQGEKGTFIRHNLDPQEESLKNGYSPKWEKWGIDNIENTFIYKNDGNKTNINVEKGCYEKYYKLLARAIKNNESVPVLPKDALDVVKIIHQIESNHRKHIL